MEGKDLRREAVRRRLAGESPADLARDLGRSDRWVRKWLARYEEAGEGEDWAGSRSHAPLGRPTRTPEETRGLVLEVRARLEANPRAQRGALAIAWELRRLGVEPLPETWTINRILHQAGVTRPRRREGRYAPRGVPYPISGAVRPGELHQADLAGSPPPGGRGAFLGP